MVSVSVLLWNVWNLPSFLSDHRSKERARIIATSRIFENYDVVILNEAFINKGELLRNKVHPYIATLERRWNSIFDSGIVVLSKYPIMEIFREYFVDRTGWDCFCSKGLVLCKIQVNEGEEGVLNIVGTHMQAGNSNADQRSRFGQSGQVARFLAKHCNQYSKIVFGGDINMGPVLDPAFQRYSCHYSDVKDAQDRHKAYVRLREEANLRDIFAPGQEEDINRFLVRNILNIDSLRYIPEPRDEQGRRLSDSAALVLTFQF
eukprot:TRINITY_DN4346_c0_g3_i1.p1 TRINITY_DN4346_c0_g3~~TRINITY_DN4346_c0_g3_i1.p1  ORF type:complete len:261 (-),score=32.46 TRINITY_DN4346_c0_g3_i1:81-863(-)